MLLCEQLKGHTFSALLAVSRGGLVPAAMMAHQLGLRFIDTLCVSSYDERSRKSIEFLKLPSEAFLSSHPAGDGVLIIDDLVDGGGTAQAVKALFPEAFFAVIYAKPQGLPFADAYVKTFEQHVWVVFPWENRSV